MPSAVDLAAAALVSLGAAPIGSFDDPTTEGLLAKRLYGLTKRGLLACHPWKGATTFAVLTPRGEAPLPGWEQAWALPVPPEECLRPIALKDPDGSDVPFRRSKDGRLHTMLRQEPPLLLYVEDLDEEQLAADLAEALVARLAAKLAMPLTQDEGLTKTMAALADQFLQDAKTSDSQSQTALTLPVGALAAGASSGGSGLRRR